jgi:hypothetical protein
LLAPLFFSILLAFFSLFQRQRYPFWHSSTNRTAGMEIK